MKFRFCECFAALHDLVESREELVYLSPYIHAPEQALSDKRRRRNAPDFHVVGMKLYGGKQRSKSES
ncbi:hypothetical protein WG66_008981 [Moniliophthora roreri]|uniref:Uncharacterized protein n=1 Tax=Moniliophthora roreri TaxID=221103 RepID=A0A0W0EUD9_MONRR|nr:hypothetical protein WG66_008981 [Moniliophthora roreri]